MAGTRRTIGLDQLDKFEIDDQNRLYWDGSPVVTMTILSIPWWGQIIATLAGLSTIGVFVIMLLQALKVL